MVAASTSTVAKRDHLLVRMRGEAAWRHGWGIDEGDGSFAWLLTPNRFLEKFSFLATYKISGMKVWDGVTLPPSVTKAPHKLARDSEMGDFTEADFASARGVLSTVIPLAGRWW